MFYDNIYAVSSKVPTGVPVNVTIEVKSSTEILVSWLPPEQLKQNGMITSYYIEINSTLVSIQSRTEYLPANTTSVLITGTTEQFVQCYNNYLILLSLVSVIGLII